jgi:hypothetical protein
VKRKYHTIASAGKANERQLTDFLSRNGQFLLPMMELIEQSRMAVEELIDVAGRVTIEAVLKLSAQQVAGEPSQGKPKNGDIGWHGTQKGSVYLRDRKLPVNKPRLRPKGQRQGQGGSGSGLCGDAGSSGDGSSHARPADAWGEHASV